jgi:hypothetical protein
MVAYLRSSLNRFEYVWVLNLCRLEKERRRGNANAQRPYILYPTSLEASWLLAVKVP